jgi:AraC-like DNA-binding protein
LLGISIHAEGDLMHAPLADRAPVDQSRVSLQLVHDSPLRPHEIDEKWFSVQDISNLVTMLRAEKTSCSDLLRELHLRDADLQDAHKLVSARQRIAAYQYARQHAQDPAFALRCGQSMRLASFGIWGYALMCCDSVAKMLDFGFRYLRLAGPLMRKSMYVEDDRVILRAEDTLLLGELFPYALEVWWASIYSAMKGILATDVKLSSVKVTYPAPAHWHAYEAAFGCKVEFGQSNCEMVLPRSYLSRRPLQANLITAEICEEVCSHMLHRLENSSGLVTRIRNLLLANVRTCPGLERIAQKVHMSPRSLRRKLQSEGTTYQEILGEVRASLAKEYLATTDLSMEQVADLIGFRHVENFQSAFKRWASQTPAQFRKKHARKS